MANLLSTDKQIAVISALAEGSSIRSIERMTGIHRDTIMRLGVRVGQGCATLLDAKMRGLGCQHLQLDELWGFIGKKEGQVPKAPKVYAWAHDMGDPNKPRRHVTVLHIHPVTSAAEAVRAAIVQEFRSLEPEQEA